MKNYIVNAANYGSEIERAAMAGGIFPVESAFERRIKQHLALGLTRLARYIDPSLVPGMGPRSMEQRCC